MAAQIVPNPLDRIELRAVRRQLQQRDIGGYHETLAAVPAGTIEDYHGMGIGRDLAADLAEMMVHGGGIADRHDQRRRFCPPTGRLHQTDRPRRSRDPSALPAGCRFAPTPGSECSSDRPAPRPETTPRLACRALVPPGLALIAIQVLRKLRLRRRIGLRVARTRGQPTQLEPMPQPVGARQTAINFKLLFQYALRVDATKRTTPSRSSTAPATIRSLNRALVAPSTRGCRPGRGRSRNPSIPSSSLEGDFGFSPENATAPAPVIGHEVKLINFNQLPDTPLSLQIQNFARNSTGDQAF